MRFFLTRSGVSGFTRPDEFDVVVAVARRLGLIGRSGSDGVIRWLIYTPKGGGTQCSGILIQIGGLALSL